MSIEKPNYTQMPNLFLDDLFRLMGEAELRVTLVIARATFGYHRERVLLSLSDLQEMTGMGRQGVVNGIKAGLERGTVYRDSDGGSFFYGLLVEGNGSPPSGLVHERDQLESPRNGLEVVHEVDRSSPRSRPELVHEVDRNTPVLKKDKEIYKERDGISFSGNGGSAKGGSKNKPYDPDGFREPKQRVRYSQWSTYLEATP